MYNFTFPLEFRLNPIMAIWIMLRVLVLCFFTSLLKPLILQAQFWWRIILSSIWLYSKELKYKQFYSICWFNLRCYTCFLFLWKIHNAKHLISFSFLSVFANLQKRRKRKKYEITFMKELQCIQIAFTLCVQISLFFIYTFPFMILSFELH